MQSQGDPYDLSTLLSQFPPPPFHVPPSDIPHKIPPHFRQNLAWKSRKVNPLQELTSPDDIDFGDEGEEDQWQDQNSKNDSNSAVGGLGANLGNHLQLPTVGGNWRISVASSFMGGGGGDEFMPTKETVNRLTRQSIMIKNTGGNRNNRNSILMPITPGALLGRELPTLPNQQQQQQQRQPYQRSISPQSTLDPNKFLSAYEDVPPQSRFSAASSSSQFSLQPPQRSDLSGANAPPAVYQPAMQRLLGDSGRSNRNSYRGGVLAQFRQQREEEEQRSMQMIREDEDGQNVPAVVGGDELLKRAILARGAVDLDAKLMAYIKGLSSVELGKIQRRIHANALQMKKNGPISAVELDRHILDFKKSPPQIGVPVSDTLTLVSKSPAASFRFVTEQTADSKFSLSIEPMTGTLNMRGLMLETVTVTLTVRSPVVVNSVVILEVEGGHRHFILVRADVSASSYPATSAPDQPTSYSSVTPKLALNPPPRSNTYQDPSNYGMSDTSSPYHQVLSAASQIALSSPQQTGQQTQPPQYQQQQPQQQQPQQAQIQHQSMTMIPPPRTRGQAGLGAWSGELVDDMIISGFPHRVPKELATLRAALMARERIVEDETDTKASFSVEGIFREKASDAEMQSAWTKLKQGQSLASVNPHAIATCIKFSFRDSQEALLAEIQPYLILGAYDEITAWEALAEVQPRTFDLITWVLDLMADVVYYEMQNGMNARNICTAFAQYLYSNTHAAQAIDAKTYAQISQQLTPFVGMLLAKRMLELDDF
ncbi:hypothetical protein HDU97_001653 [Phlyctochytrium planicorne]|nr:hypothetical protein HDU97_001653 [Phlyctochytrium planicorne]